MASAECRSRLCLPTHICSTACGSASDCLGGGNWRCSEIDGLGSRCVCDQVSPKETCNGNDDDCSGVIDDGALCPFTQQCIAGQCQCPPPASLCGELCADLDTDPQHCGDCLRSCPSAALPSNTERACEKGTCGWRCKNGWGDCDGNAANGCEQLLNTQAHCGGCKVTCQGFCAGGQCCDHPVVQAQCNGGFCTIPAGCFMMGSPKSEPCRLDGYSELPMPAGWPWWKSDWQEQHPVRLTRTFELGEAPVTQAGFSAVMGYNPSARQSPNPQDPNYCGTTEESCGKCPVGPLTWHEAAAYCNALSQQAGLAPCYACIGSQASTMCTEQLGFERSQIYACPGYRLPTEAEWEYAYRAGTTTAYYNGYNGDPMHCSWSDPALDPIVWGGCPVKAKQPNAWGLHDVTGLAQWANDRFGPYEIALGPPLDDPWGSLYFWMEPPWVGWPSVRGGTATSRIPLPPDSRSAFFRCVRGLPPQP